jgi:hypothetical protein
MDFESACKWLNAADVIESQEILATFKSSDWPYLKKRDREKTHKELHQKAYPFEWSNSAPLSIEDAAKKLSGLSIPKGRVK